MVLLILMTQVQCGKGLDGECGATVPSGATGSPPMTFYFGANTAPTGTALTAVGQFNGYIQASGCGPFGIWENSNGGEVATEIEMRLNTRLGVFALADGKVTKIQASTSPFEAGEVEGVFVKYGENYTIKYAHVKDPIVSAGDTVTSGQRIGSTVQSSAGQFFWEAELRHKSGSKVYAEPWNSLLSNATVFNSLYGAGNCTPGGTIYGTDGHTVTTASNWASDSLIPARWDMSGMVEQCNP